MKMDNTKDQLTQLRIDNVREFRILEQNFRNYAKQVHKKAVALQKMITPYMDTISQSLKETREYTFGLLTIQKQPNSLIITPSNEAYTKGSLPQYTYLPLLFWINKIDKILETVPNRDPDPILGTKLRFSESFHNAQDMFQCVVDLQRLESTIDFVTKNFDQVYENDIMPCLIKYEQDKAQNISNAMETVHEALKKFYEFDKQSGAEIDLLDEPELE